MVIRIDPKTFREIEREQNKLRKLKSGLSDRRSLLERFKKDQVKRWEVNFTAQGGMYGSWPPLSDVTIDKRAQRISSGAISGVEPDTPILVQTGKLHNAFKSMIHAGSVGEKRLQWNFDTGEGTGWFFTHQFGLVGMFFWSGGWIEIPERPMVFTVTHTGGHPGPGGDLGLSPEEKDDLLTMSEEWVESIVHKYYKD